MKDFYKIITVQAHEVDKRLDDGWELIDTTSEAYGDGGFYLNYHLGLPSRTIMNRLQKIIQSYEENGFKEQLFSKVAENNGENFESYTDSSFSRTKDETTAFIESYELIVHDKKVSYYKKDDRYYEMHSKIDDEDTEVLF